VKKLEIIQPNKKDHTTKHGVAVLGTSPFFKRLDSLFRLCLALRLHLKKHFFREMDGAFSSLGATYRGKILPEPVNILETKAQHMRWSEVYLFFEKPSEAYVNQRRPDLCSGSSPLN
jgi:hypothetical protein